VTFGVSTGLAQNPSTKTQTQTILKLKSQNSSRDRRSLEFAGWSLFSFWCLDLAQSGGVVVCFLANTT
jgi:hypothetical protein